MQHLIKKLTEYAKNPQSPELNYDLALIYDDMGQTASASTHYLRAAERYDIPQFIYECLLKYASCYDRQGNRDHTVSVIHKHAICIQPNRPEAYFLQSKLHERRQEWVDSYVMASIGENCPLPESKLRTDVGYPGEYGCTFQRGVAAWWWGKSQEARETFSTLCQLYHDKMSPEYYNAVANNLNMLGAGKDDEVFKKYDKSMHDRLRFKFEGSDAIEQNHSQVYQDLFILAALKGKRNGSFLEIGGYTPYRGNNTALLEEKYGWNGVSVEIRQECVDEYRAARRTKVLCADATKVNYEQVLSELAPNGVVDYLQLDVEPPSVTFEAMLAIPFHKYKFAVITYEHDHYMDMTQSYREKSRRFLESYGYQLIVPNVASNNHAVFEDWWIHPDLVSQEVINDMKVDLQEALWKTEIDKYMFSK